LSLKELWLERRYARQKQHDESDRDTVLAWQIMRVKIKSMKSDGRLVLPTVTELLPPRHHPDQVSILYAIAATHGLTVKRVPRTQP
jgi:hypothetical protein